VTVFAAGLVFGEQYAALQRLGVLTLSGGILALSAVNVAGVGIGRARLASAILWALLTGVFVAAYTTYDAYGIRATPNPFTFLAWFFVLDGLLSLGSRWLGTARCPNRPSAARCSGAA
jgi:hypothetical protein